MSYIFITEPYISSYADIDVLLAIWRSGALHYYSTTRAKESTGERITSAKTLLKHLPYTNASIITIV
jgi:hypothetical protein